ncbi:hypothetical protein BIW11_07851 [Tropilaelaps mercedesae]|uniref:Uncharacterized protein n=1 Tax=Tropilaelaps mercedesae TaxID=418985 RepID=A0A1V9XS54_9ACAR|nr:hypothetical protein BIW11_07851 [Tropilaelaps mercedesae]
MVHRLLTCNSATAALLKAGFSRKLPSLSWGPVRLCHGTGTKISQENRKVTDIGGKATEEQLAQMERDLAETIPVLFHAPHNYKLYTQGVIFEDNIRNIRTNGLPSYAMQISMIRFWGHIRYAHIKMNVLKVYSDPVDSSVKVRWRVDGISGLRMIFSLWKYSIFRWREALGDKGYHVDGFSIFFVNSEGKIWKHVADKMMPDEDRAVLPTERKTLAGKMAAALAVGWSGAQSVSEIL